MRIAFRTDASLAIGTGHVMRCLALAQKLQGAGAHCIFLSRAHEGNLLALTAARGFETRPLPATQGSAIGDGYMAWLGVDPVIDATQTLDRLDDGPVDWLIVDHYALDVCWERHLRQRCRHTMVIDDLADRPHDCDILLDQNLGRTFVDYEHLVPPSCQLMVGPFFALLRPDFAALRTQSLSRRTTGRIGHILVTMGGVDRENVTGDVLQALGSTSLHHRIKLTVVMGATAPWRADVNHLAATLPFQVRVLFDVQNMAELMMDADLAIGAAGSTSWERCCMGLPAIQLILAENQRPIAQALANAGVAVLLDRKDLTTGISNFLDASVLSSETIVRMSNAASAITDGKGLDRIYAAIESRLFQ